MGRGESGGLSSGLCSIWASASGAEPAKETKKEQPLRFQEGVPNRAIQGDMVSRVGLGPFLAGVVCGLVARKAWSD